MKRKSDRVKVMRPGGATTFMARGSAENLREKGWRIVEDVLVEVPDMDEPRKPGRPRKSQSNAH